ncbi:MAG: hypothetical protein WBD40_22115 [Tepidisphaeraceae bacterium]
MDERFKELARLVGEQLAQRWVERATESDPSCAKPQGDAAVIDDHEAADSTPLQRDH